MPVALAFILVGFLVVTSALKGKTVADLLRDGLGTPFNPAAGPPATSVGNGNPDSMTPIPTPGGKVVELFYDPLGGWDCESGNCVSIGAIGGHSDHVHVGGEEGVIEHLITVARERFNLRVNPNTNQRPGTGSHHNPGGRYAALDASGNPADMLAYARYVKDNYIR